MVMGALMDIGAQQGQALPMTMYTPTATENVGATGLGNTAGASAKESQEETEDEPTENGDQLAASGKKSQEAEV